MSFPNPFKRRNAYLDWTQQNPDRPHPGQDFEEDFDEVARVTSEIIDSLAKIQREDGELANASVGRDQLKPGFINDILNDIASSGFVGPQGPAGPQLPGPVGAQGPRGPALPWIVAPGIPSNSFGVPEQLYLNSTNGDVYQKSLSGWQLTGNIRGPAGTGGGGGVTVHGLLSGLDNPDHPISAIQGLQPALDDLASAIFAVASQRLNVYRQDHPPTANLNAGDLWFDSSNSDRLYLWDGNQWVDVRDKQIDTVAAQAAEAISAAAGAQAAADGKITTFFGSAPPHNAREGDLWFRADEGNKLYRYDGSDWTAVADEAIAAAIQAAATAQATADGKIETFFQPNPPVGASLGDLWYDTDDGNHPYRHNGAQWVSVRDAAVLAAASDAAQAIQTASNALAEAQSIADGVVEVYYQESPPAEADLGDLWISTAAATLNQLHRFNGEQWVSVQDKAIAEALTSAQLAQDIADGKLRAFYQNSAPTADQGRSVGDIWYDLDDNNRPYRFNGTSWVDLTPIQGVTGGLITGVSIANGTITANKLNVSSLSAISANIGTVTAGLLRNAANTAAFDLTNSRILFNTGTVMMVIGLGFGTSNQFLLWFGPTRSNVNQCSEANAIFYLRKDGAAYFGGSLSAGVLRNAGQTTNTAPNAEITVGPFGSNGKPITVAWSYSWNAQVSGNGAGFNPTATVRLYRRVGSGAETLVQEQHLTGSHEVLQGGMFSAQWMGGSWTLTDNLGTTQNRTYRAVIVSRTAEPSGSSKSISQNLSIVCTEQ